MKKPILILILLLIGSTLILSNTITPDNSKTNTSVAVDNLTVSQADGDHTLGDYQDNPEDGSGGFNTGSDDDRKPSYWLPPWET